jgi:predicted Zn-dependent protease
MYDDDPKQGVVDGATFRHPDLKLTFAAPPGFVMNNGTRAVTISGSSGQAQFTGLPYSGSLSTYIDTAFKQLAGQNASISYGEVRTTEVNGLKAAYASANANTNSGQILVTVFAYELSPTSAFHFVTYVPASGGDPFASLFKSMRRMTAQEVAAVRPRKISVIVVRSGDTVASLSARMGYDSYREERFRVLNALGNGATVRPGQKVKIVVRG